MQPLANLIEIFSSFQGEGPYVGEAMTFVRFQRCALSCQFCDTPASFKQLKEFQIEVPPKSKKFSQSNNPVTVEGLNEILTRFPDPTLSITGGEPLQHCEFLEAWLPTICHNHRILLETNGVLFDEMKRLKEFVDIISMDLKLPTATGMRAYWKEHEAFLKVIHGTETYIKVVLLESTSEEDLRIALELVKQYAPKCPLFLQPVTPMGKIKESVSNAKLQKFFELAKGYLENIRVLSQVHPKLGWL